jgi:hypothetical protein
MIDITIDQPFTALSELIVIVANHQCCEVKAQVLGRLPHSVWAESRPVAKKPVPAFRFLRKSVSLDPNVPQKRTRPTKLRPVAIFHGEQPGQLLHRAGDFHPIRV